ncbi:MAG TPA: NADP(H)-dependent aldo-keto reductase [Alphaproteobacteria bacterium]|nr:NADP(H)-dependent aldo-keto reductase [Alphaproteobacteria bacterium]
MKFRRLGRTALEVSPICLGTMTWGRQNTEAEAHEQMDYALDQGINFFDTAEMYAVPPTAETYGKTEQYIGTWFKARGSRDRVILASKIMGPGRATDHVRDGDLRLDRKNIVRAVEDSLTRLRTDYIDLYQLHWPDRDTNTFGRLDYVHNPEERATPPLETLEALGELVKQGKIRHVGLSNETPWGLMTFLKLAELYDLPRAVSIQNPYSLLNRSFEVGLAECAIREECGLLAYSPLAAGTLTGKYLDGQVPPGTRRAIDHRPSRYAKPRGDVATRAYLDIAKRHGLDPAQMAIAFVMARPFVTSAIIGATSMDQLRTDIGARDVVLGDAVLAELEAVHADNPNPCP